MGAQQAARAFAVSLVPVLLVAGCGGGQTQDANAVRGNFPVSVERAFFPSDQSLAKNSDMVVVVRNSGNRTVPNVNVTLKCGPGLAGSFQVLSPDPQVADPRRPQFIVDTIPTRISTQRPTIDPAPLEHSSADADTYPLGQLRPGQSVTFDWKVTASIAGPYRVCYRVNADLYGDAHAVPASGSLPLRGEFSGVVSNTPPRACIGPDDKSVTRNCR